MAEKQPNDKKQKLDLAIIGLLILGLYLAIGGFLFLIKNFNMAEPFLLSDIFAVAALFIGILLILGALHFKQAFHDIPIWCFVGLLAVCVVVLFKSIGFNENIDEKLRAKSFYIAGFAFLLLIAGKTCIKAWLKFRFEQGPKTDKVDFDGNNHAVEAMFWLGNILIAFGWLAYNFLPAAQNLFDATKVGGKTVDGKTVDGVISNPITLYMLVLSAAGMAFFWWAAKSNHIKVVQINEQKINSDREAEKNTVQLIKDATNMMGQDKSETEKSAGLIFLNKLATNKDGLFQKESMDFFVRYIEQNKNIKVDDNLIFQAVDYLDKMIEKGFAIRVPSITITGNGTHSAAGFNNDKFFHNFYVKYIKILIEKIDFNLNNKNHTVYNCFLNGCNITDKVYFNTASFERCKITHLDSTEDSNVLTKAAKYEGQFQFQSCDFSGCKIWPNVSINEFNNCYYYWDNKPDEQFLDQYGTKLDERDPVLRNDDITIGAQ